MKNMRKTIAALFLAGILASGIIVPASAVFSDVPAGAWYAQDVADVQKYGIINGVGSERFAPDGLLTYAQAITMAARAYAYMTDETIPESAPAEWSVTGKEWWAPYLYYADESGILDPDYPIALAHMADPCQREFMANLFFGVVAWQDNIILNDIQTIPDVYEMPDGQRIYNLYRYGILTGSDKYGTFYPYRDITRAETAAILNRVLDVDKRKSFRLEPKPLLTEKEAIALVLPVAVEEQEQYGAVVMKETANVVEKSGTAFVVVVGVADSVNEKGEWEGGGFDAVYWISRRTGDVRFVTGLQDYYIPGIVDLETGDYLGYPGGY